MATTVLKSPPTFSSPAAYLSNVASAQFSPNIHRVSFMQTRFPGIKCRINSGSCRSRVKLTGRTFRKFSTFAADGESAGAQTEMQEKVSTQGLESEPVIEENEVDEVDVDASSESDGAVAEEPGSVVLASLEIYKEAFANNDESKATEVESFLKSIEDEKTDLESKVTTLYEELSYEKERVLRISADFDNFRKRTERERLSLVTNARGEVVESLLPVIDNFERAKAQIKVENEGEEKINNSYQNINKQFGEILASLGVVPVETVGKPFDPMLHEAIMREDSAEYEDGIILEEYRKGFQLGDRLLRPSMVKVSAGPGPGKPETNSQPEEEDQKEVSEAGIAEPTPTAE